MLSSRNPNSGLLLPLVDFQYGLCNIKPNFASIEANGKKFTWFQQEAESFFHIELGLLMKLAHKYTTNQ